MSARFTAVDGHGTRIQIWTWNTLGGFIAKDNPRALLFRMFGLIVVLAIKQVGEEPARETW
jgi:hypothetical protein